MHNDCIVEWNRFKLRQMCHAQKYTKIPISTAITILFFAKILHKFMHAHTTNNNHEHSLCPPKTLLMMIFRKNLFLCSRIFTRFIQNLINVEIYPFVEKLVYFTLNYNAIYIACTLYISNCCCFFFQLLDMHKYRNISVFIQLGNELSVNFSLYSKINKLKFREMQLLNFIMINWWKIFGKFSIMYINNNK